MTAKASRMEVNSAIEKLIARSEDSEDAARIVIRYGNGLKPSGNIQIESSSNTIRPKGSISGYSPGHGNVTIQDDEEKKEYEFMFGLYKDRVGYYRLWKEGRGLVCFHRFWKSGLVTRGFDDIGPDVYYLAYDATSLEPEYLGIKRSRVTLNLGIIKFSVNYLEPILGSIKDPNIGFTVSM